MNDLLFALVEQEEYEILLEEAMNEYGQSILQLVYSYVRNSTVSEDLTQEIFVKFYNSLSTYSKQSSLKTWLWRIAINHCKDYLKVGTCEKCNLQNIYIRFLNQAKK